MAVYLNRTLSAIAGNSSPSHENTNGLDRSLGHIGYENSPLQIFVKAKRKINDIFGEIEEYVIETARFMEGKPFFSFNFLLMVFIQAGKGRVALLKI